MDFVGNIHDRAPPPPPAYRPRPSPTTTTATIGTTGGTSTSKASSSSTSSAYANSPLTQPTPNSSSINTTIQGQNRNNVLEITKEAPLAESTPLHPTNTKPSGIKNTLENTPENTVLVPDKSTTEDNTVRNTNSRETDKRIYSEMINASTSEKFWYKPKMSRDKAIQLLKNATPGDFIVRDSKSYQGSYGLCVRVERHQVPRSVLDSLPPNSDESCQLVRHFLIEGSQKGVKVAGSDREPNFASLAALIHQHCHTPLSLPIKLNIPQYDITTTDPNNKQTNKQNNHNSIDQISTTLYYLHETDTEMLTGEAAIERCYEVYKSSSSNSSSGCSIHVKASSEGLLLTDSKLTKFFRKHYSSDSISYCGYYNGQSGTTDKWTNQNASQHEKIIGIVAKKSASNTCVLLKTDQTKISDNLIKYLSMIIQKNSLMDGTQNGIY